MVNITIKCMYSLMGDVDDVLSDDQFMYCLSFFLMRTRKKVFFCVTNTRDTHTQSNHFWITLNVMSVIK